MLIKEFLETVSNQIKYKPIRKDIEEELTIHIEELKECYKKDGVSSKEAEEKAVSNMGDGETIGKRLNKIHKPKLDWILVIMLIAILCFGILVAITRDATIDNRGFLDSHIKGLIIGFIISIVIYFFNYKKILKHSNLIFGIASFLLIISFILGFRNGYNRYINFFNFELNSSYTAMYLYIISFAGFIVNLNNNSKIEFVIKDKKIFINKEIIKLILNSVISIVLMAYSDSTSSLIILINSYFIVLAVYIKNINIKIKRKLIISIIVVLSILSVNAICIFINTPHILNRIEFIFNNEADPMGIGYLPIQINKTLDNATLYGKINNDSLETISLFNSMTNYAILSLIQNYGILVASCLILLMTGLGVKLFINSRKVKDLFGKLLIIGFTSIILLQIILNVLVNFAIIPEIDVTLPFVAYGRNCLIMNMMAVAFILSIYRRKDILLKEDKKDFNKKLKVKIFYE